MRSLVASSQLVRLQAAAAFVGLSLTNLSAQPRQAAAPNAQAQQSAGPSTITWFQPLLRAAAALEQRYGRAVTFEDPLREWPGDIDVTPSGKVRLKQHSLTIPGGVVSGDAPSVLSAAVVQKVIDAYHQQNPQGARYQVLESGLGFHIVPTQVRDANGALRGVKNPLDLRIDVPYDSRTAFEHLQAVANAAGVAAGMRVVPFNPFFDGYFAANGYMLPMGGATPADRQYMIFKWGATGVTAREALIDLLLHSASTMSWELSCLKGALDLPGNACVLNIMDVQVGNPPRALAYDRCTNCRLMPGH